MKLLRFFASIRIFHFSFYIHIRWLDGVGVSVGYISSGSQFFMINPQADFWHFVCRSVVITSLRLKVQCVKFNLTYELSGSLVVFVSEAL